MRKGKMIYGYNVILEVSIFTRYKRIMKESTGLQVYFCTRRIW